MIANEICNQCGKPVHAGSGNYTNRVKDLDDIETRKKNGVPFPEGDYLCADCALWRQRKNGGIKMSEQNVNLTRKEAMVLQGLIEAEKEREQYEYDTERLERDRKEYLETLKTIYDKLDTVEDD